MSVTFVNCDETATDTAIVTMECHLANKVVYNRKPYPSFRMVPFSMTLSNPYAIFQGYGITNYNYAITSYNGILIATYTRRTGGCNFE